MPMICPHCDGIWSGHGPCPTCFRGAWQPETLAEVLEHELRRPGAKLPPDDLERNTPIRGIVEGQDES